MAWRCSGIQQGAPSNLPDQAPSSSWSFCQKYSDFGITLRHRWTQPTQYFQGKGLTLERGIYLSPSPLLPTTPPGQTRLSCQVKSKQSSDWIIIYSLLNLNQCEAIKISSINTAIHHRLSWMTPSICWSGTRSTKGNQSKSTGQIQLLFCFNSLL